MKWHACDTLVTIEQMEERIVTDMSYDITKVQTPVPYRYPLIMRSEGSHFAFGMVKVQLLYNTNTLHSTYVHVKHKTKLRSFEDISIWYDLVLRYEEKWYIVARARSRDSDNTDGRTICKEAAQHYHQLYTDIIPFRDTITIKAVTPAQSWKEIQWVPETRAVEGIQLCNGQYYTRSWRYYVDDLLNEER
jgi:hypothetical protein